MHTAKYMQGANCVRCIQNLLDKEGRELARDSDATAALVEERERAVEENLDTSVLEETAALAAEMGTQLYNFANMLATYLNADDEKEQE